MTRPDASPIAISIDLEEYFQVEAMARVVARESWGGMASRIEATTERLLEIFAAAGATTTFFVVGWVAERHPRLIARIAAAGHEIGCHSYWHRPVFRLSPAEFREDTRRAREAIAQAIGGAVAGYRAPNFSIRLEMGWAWEILAEAGFAYDSSIHPVRHPLYGAPDAPRQPFRLPCGLWEFPLATLRLWGQPLPMAGGAYWRLAPLAYTRWALRRAAAAGQRPICYLHPWELDPEQPRVALPPANRFRHYTGLARTEPRLRALLGRFRCQPIRRLLACELAQSQPHLEELPA